MKGVYSGIDGLAYVNSEDGFNVKAKHGII
jgi:hypothetical protein